MPVYNVTPYYNPYTQTYTPQAFTQKVLSGNQPLQAPQQVPVNGFTSAIQAPPPPQLNLTFDTIGQVIYRTLGHCRLPFKYIWVEHLQAGFDSLITTALTSTGSDVLHFSFVPSWLLPGTLVSGAAGVVAGTEISSISGSDVILNTPVVADVPIDSAIVFQSGMGRGQLSPNSIATSADAFIGGFDLTFSFVPTWIQVLDSVAGTGVPGGSVVASLSSTTITLSQPLDSDVPAGSVISFGGFITLSFAAALCRPIDPEEVGNIIEIWDSGNLVYSTEFGITPPPGWDPTSQALLIASLLGVLIYPGDEIQAPCPLIVSDKGAAITNAFRGIRYIVVPGYPIAGTGQGAGRGGPSGFPILSATFARTNPAKSTNIIAVTFAAGSG